MTVATEISPYLPNISITSDDYVQDGRRRLINGVDLLPRLIEWRAQSRGEMERQIVGKNIERREGGWGWGGGRRVACNVRAGRDRLLMCPRSHEGNIVSSQPDTLSLLQEFTSAPAQNGEMGLIDMFSANPLYPPFVVACRSYIRKRISPPPPSLL